MAPGRGRRGGARGGRGGSRATRETKVRTPDEEEPKSKRPKEEAAEETLPDLLVLPKHILIQIANKLKPESLRNLAFTCKNLLHFCQNTNGINVVYSIDRIQTDWNDRRASIGCHYTHDNKEGEDCDHRGRHFVEFMKKLRRWPFAIEIDRLEHNLNISYEDAGLRELFEQHGVKKIYTVGGKYYEDTATAPKTARDAKFVAEFVEAFEIDKISIESLRGMSPDAVEACFSLPLKEFRVTDWDRFNNIGALLTSSIPTMVVNCDLPFISKDEFWDVVKMWLTKKGLEWWEFGYVGDIMDHMDGYEIRSFIYAGPISRSNPPVFLKTGDSMMHFYILGQDGTVLRISVGSEPYIEFSICPANEAPPALRDL